MERICHHAFDAQELVTKYPPRLSNRNKEIVFQLSTPPGAMHSGSVIFSRWRHIELPESFELGKAND